MAAKKAKGKILIFVDADMYFGKKFIEDLIKPIIKGKGVGTVPAHQNLGNPDKIFAYLRYHENEQRYRTAPKTTIFRAVRKDVFLKAGGYDVSKDYFDDTSLSEKLGKTPLIVKGPEFYHNFTETFTGIIEDSSWGSRSAFRERGLKSAGFPLSLAFVFFILMQPVLILFFGLWLPLIYVIAFLLFGLYGASKFRIRRVVMYYPIFYLARIIGITKGFFEFVFTREKRGK